MYNFHSSISTYYVFFNTDSIEFVYMYYTEDLLPARNYILYSIVIYICQYISSWFDDRLETISFIDLNVCVFLFFFCFRRWFSFFALNKYSVHLCVLLTHTRQLVWLLIVMHECFTLSLSLLTCVLTIQKSMEHGINDIHFIMGIGRYVWKA